MNFRYQTRETDRFDDAAQAIQQYVVENVAGPAALKGLPQDSLIGLAGMVGLLAGLALACRHVDEAQSLGVHATRRYGIHPAARRAYYRLRGERDA